MFEIECPACGKKNTVMHIEDESLCKRCQADLTALIRIRSAVARMSAQAITCLIEKDLRQAQAIVNNISRLTPLSHEEPLVLLLKSVNAEQVPDVQMHSDKAAFGHHSNLGSEG
jgi:hypothetical protein